jgi:hypothetical protein
VLLDAGINVVVADIVEVLEFSTLKARKTKDFLQCFFGVGRIVRLVMEMYYVLGGAVSHVRSFGWSVREGSGWSVGRSVGRSVGWGEGVDGRSLGHKLATLRPTSGQYIVLFNRYCF